MPRPPAPTRAARNAKYCNKTIAVHACTMRVLDKVHAADALLHLSFRSSALTFGHSEATSRLCFSRPASPHSAYDSYPISIPSFRRRLADTARHLTRPSPLDQLLVQRGVEAAERARVDGTRLCKLAAALVPLRVAAPQAARLMPVLTERCLEE